MIPARCVPCEGARPLGEAEAGRMLLEVPSWRLQGNRLVREFHLRDFAACMDFLGRVAAVAEEEQHHPDLHLERYKHVRIELWTHAAGGVTENDFVLAARIDALEGGGRPHRGLAAGPTEVLVRQLETSCIIGTQPKERAAPQRVTIELAITVDAPEAAATDDIRDTLDYKRVKDRILADVAQSRYQLLEALAERVAELVLAEPRAQAVEVTVDKPGALTGARSVAVRIRRAKRPA